MKYYCACGSMDSIHEMELSSHMKFEDLATYQKIMGSHTTGNTIPMVSLVYETEFTIPYAGRKPKFVLWGGRAGDVQIGSREDRWWQRRLSNTTRIKITIPRIKWFND